MPEIYITAHVWLMDAWGRAIHVAGFIFADGMPANPLGFIGF